MPVYDLNQISFLRHDIENSLDLIGNLYLIKFTANGGEYFPKTVISNENNWTSEACKAAFNKIVPSAKSLIKDMYAQIENLFKGKGGSFTNLDKEKLENRHPCLKELRLINNKVKHFNDSTVEITLSEMVMMESDGHHIDILFNLMYKDGLFKALRLADLIDVYLRILEDQKMISIQRSN